MNQQQNNKQPVAPKRRRAAGTPGAGNAGERRQGAPHKQGRRPGFYAQRNKPAAAKPAALKLYPLGGLGEIGKNLTVYECGEDMIIVDCGSLFPESDMYGIDLVIPDFSFIEQNRDKLRGIIITHGHEDHIGALPYLLREVQLPVYGTRLTIGLIENKLEEHGLRSSVDTRVLCRAKSWRLAASP